MLELGNLRLVSGQKSFIQISNGTIHGISETAMTEQWIDCNGNLAVPGIIDPHVHAREDQPEKESPEALELAAILGGVTLIARMPNTKVLATTCEIINKRAIQASTGRISNRYWIGATNDNFREVELAFLLLHATVCGVKIYMGSSTGNLLVSDPKTIRQHFAIAAECRKPAAVHAEDEAMMQKHFSSLEGHATIEDHCKIRNTEVEVSAVKLALQLQAEVGNVLYFCHISTPESLELIMDAKSKGRTVYAEVCPHHLYLVEDLLSGKDGGKYKMNPPLRTPAQVEAMRRYVCSPGWVDTIGSDHAPHHRSEKEGRDYLHTASGVPGVQTILPLLFSLVRKNEMSIEHFVNLTSLNAAQILSLPQQRGISEGAPADIAIINDTEIRWLSDRDMATLWRWTPFSGMVACGFPSHVIANGLLEYTSRLIR